MTENLAWWRARRVQETVEWPWFVRVTRPVKTGEEGGRRREAVYCETVAAMGGGRDFHCCPSFFSSSPAPSSAARLVGARGRRCRRRPCRPSKAKRRPDLAWTWGGRAREAGGPCRVSRLYVAAGRSVSGKGASPTARDGYQEEEGGGMAKHGRASENKKRWCRYSPTTPPPAGNRGGARTPGHAAAVNHGAAPAGRDNRPSPPPPPPDRQPTSCCVTMSFVRCGSARPPDAARTLPTKKPNSLVLPCAILMREGGRREEERRRGRAPAFRSAPYQVVADRWTARPTRQQRPSKRGRTTPVNSGVRVYPLGCPRPPMGTGHAHDGAVQTRGLHPHHHPTSRHPQNKPSSFHPPGSTSGD